MTLRPIRPEDEPRWHRLLEACSPETLHARFHYLFKAATHEMATRYCFVDYDRKMALVAQVDATGEFAGIARLVADSNHMNAEFSILVADHWQGIGIGMLLTENCLNIAQDWGLRKVTAITMLTNEYMQSIFKQYKFDVEYDPQAGIIKAHKSLATGD